MLGQPIGEVKRQYAKITKERSEKFPASLKSSSFSRSSSAPVRFRRTEVRPGACFRKAAGYVLELRNLGKSGTGGFFRSLDHDVTLPSGVKVYNPMRVFPNNDGSELVFTLYRRPDMSDQEFAEDAKSVEKDLANLKTLLEK